MADRADITPEICRQLLDYDPLTGALTWRRRARELSPTDKAHAVWNGRFAGKSALTANSRGYRVGMINNVMMKAHRVAWAIHYGQWPEVIDHINGDPADNRIANLRSVGQSENLCNQARRSDNSSMRTGVFPMGDRWGAEIKRGAERRRLGSFSSREDAAAARSAAEIEMGFHPNHGR